jgi:Xaa-Pro aminopeptidase
LYIPAGSRGVAKKWWDIGIRIEDDVLVTRDGPEVLTEAAPRTVAEIEALMAVA